MKTNTFPYRLLAGLCLVAFVAPAWGAAQAGITAQLEPHSIRLGESAQLVVNVQGAQTVSPNVPRVDGLEIVPIGQQSSMQVINGVVSANASLIYQVVPERTGDFTIPPIEATGVGSTQPIALRVQQGAVGRAQRPMSPSSTAGFALDDAAPVDSNGESVFLRVVLPKDKLVVGELVPVEVKAYFRAGVSASLNGLPMLSSDAFTLNPLGDEPTQTREMVDGVPHTVVTWTTELSAVKAGDYPLDLELPVMVRAQERGRRRNMGGRDPFQDFFGGGSPFSDPFFDDFFGSVTEKPLTLQTDSSILKIQALPAQGKPADFSGAVGQFDVTSEASATAGTTGEPLTLKLTVAGRGNFDRVLSDGLPASADWKSYNTSAQFEPTDRSNTTGIKTFEQSIVPTTAGAQEIPALSFSYFDPEKGTYVTKKTDAIPIEIAQGVASTKPAAKTPAVEAPETTPEGLAIDKPVTGIATSSLRPLVLVPWFVAVNAAMLLALGIGVLVRAVRDRRARDPRRRERLAAEKAVRESLAAMDSALAAKDAPRFFYAARRALQGRLAAKWSVPVSRVTIPEIRTRLDEQGEEVSAVFKTADEIAYSGQHFTTPDLQQWRDFVKNQLLQIAR